MPIYPFICPSGHRTERFLRMEDRDQPQRCGMCAKRMTRQIAAFGISGEHHAHTMYEYERDAWALATGQNHRTAGELEAWAKANGKTILSNKETLRPVDNTPTDHEIEKALTKVYDENHSCGTIATGESK